MATEHQHLLGEQQEHYGVCHPKGPLYKWIILFFVALICFGSYFAYDEISPFEDVFGKDLGIDTTHFNLLYSIYSFPNIILVFFGGILGDKIGLRLAGLIFVLFVFAGSVIVPFAAAVSGHLLSEKNAYWLMFAGRFVFGLGGESLNVIQTTMVAVWFSGTSQLALAMGLTLSMSRLGDYLALSFATNIADAFGGYKIALWVGAALVGLSFLSVLIYSVLDKAAEKHFPERKVDPEANQLNFGAVLKFDPRFWIVSFLCLSYYCGVMPFNANSNAFLQQKYGMDNVKAGHYASIVILAAMFLSPILGKVLDVIGKRPYAAVFGSFLILPAHLLFAFTHVNPLIPLIMIGLSFSIVPSSLWPSVPLITKDSETATAFGVMTSIQNFGLTVCGYAVGAIAKHSWKNTMLFFAGMDLLGLVLGLLLVIVDSRMGSTLCQASGAKKEETQTVDVYGSINQEEN